MAGKKSAKRIAKLERQIARLRTRLPKAVRHVVRAELSKKHSDAIGFATVYPVDDD